MASMVPSDSSMFKYITGTVVLQKRIDLSITVVLEVSSLPVIFSLSARLWLPLSSPPVMLTFCSPLLDHSAFPVCFFNEAAAAGDSLPSKQSSTLTPMPLSLSLRPSTVTLPTLPESKLSFVLSGKVIAFRSATLPVNSSPSPDFVRVTSTLSFMFSGTTSALAS